MIISFYLVVMNPLIQYANFDHHVSFDTSSTDSSYPPENAQIHEEWFGGGTPAGGGFCSASTSSGHYWTATFVEAFTIFTIEVKVRPQQ